MFFEVTTMVAAAVVVLAITAETTAAITAFFIEDPPLSTRLHGANRRCPMQAKPEASA
jgi:hypothetical protein